MRPVGNGRPGTSVLPDAAALAPVVTATLSDQCTIRHPGTTGGAFDPATGKRTGAVALAPHYMGACRVDPLSDTGRLAVVADEQVPTATHLVTLERDAAPGTAVDDIVTVAGMDDLVVGWVEHASETFSRVLICTQNQS